jgi:chromosome segregation ATPase
MRRVAFLVVGVLELCVAGVLLALVRYLPSSADVRGSMDRAERIGKQAGSQIHKLRDQLQTFRQRQPELNRMTAQLQVHLQKVGKQLSDPQVDFKALEAVRDALSDAAMGIEGIGQALDPRAVAQLGTALGATATYLEDKVIPAASKTADHLELSTHTLKMDADRLSQVLRTVASDPEAYQQGINRLAQMDRGIVWLMERSTPERLNEWKDHLGSLQSQLTSASRQVEELAGQTYPTLTFRELVPVMVYHPLWPEGKDLAHSLVQASDMVGLCQRYLAWLAERTESYQAFLKEMRTGIGQASHFLETALGQYAEMGPLFRDLPAHAARFAEELPRIGKELVRVLRDATRLKDVAVVLRQAKKSLDSVLASWPDMKKQLGQSVVMLRTVRNQLNYTLDHRDEYEEALQQASLLLETLSTSLPVFTKQLEQDLAEQVESLAGLGKSIGDVTATLPGTARSANRIVQLTRLLLALLAGIFALHAGYLLYESWVVGSNRVSEPSAAPGREALPASLGVNQGPAANSNSA